MAIDRAALIERTFLELVAGHQKAILNYLYRLVGDPDVAEDLTQDTFVKAYRAMDSLDLRAESADRRRAWLYRIAHNTATDHLRRRARLRWLGLDELRSKGGADPLDELVQREPVVGALAELSPEQREVLILFGYVGLTAAEVAEVLGITAEAARKRRQRAREAFAAALQRTAGAGQPPLASASGTSDDEL